ncbi:hypothetical protein Rumeso_03348 [Rubellimicrobium mesophilum DSM 19309]|uniref:Uncharacterized protein n=1 Tax=Rubellimicrobium mesophilum DSM 19309 TaxID=442562 RepID=A0A017HMW7_9RHOB|nr:hypothetical protein Rumeso_03348 [Rubellimicrobium mesophilum DSM 19309]
MVHEAGKADADGLHLAARGAGAQVGHEGLDLVQELLGRAAAGGGGPGGLGQHPAAEIREDGGMPLVAELDADDMASLGHDLQGHGRASPPGLAAVERGALHLAQEAQADQVGGQRRDRGRADPERPRHVGPCRAALGAHVVEDLPPQRGLAADGSESHRTHPLGHLAVVLGDGLKCFVHRSGAKLFLHLRRPQGPD